jgi:hypothetical protein
MKICNWLVPLTLAGACFTAPVLAQPEAGERSFSLSGSGTSDKDFDNGALGVDAQIGWHKSKNLEWGLRQNVSFSNSDLNDTQWNGASRGYVDYFFDFGQWQPFIGASLGYIYGESTEESFIAGPEVGVRYYVKPKTYILGQMSYQYIFDDAGDIDNSFSDGAMFFNVGIGYDF